MELRDYVGVLSKRVLNTLAAADVDADGMFERALEGPHEEVMHLQPSLKEYFNYVGTVVIGTGGQLEWPLAFDSLLESAAPTGALAVFHCTRVPPRTPDVRTVQEDVAVIKSAFGLSVSQMADVLKVRRPTIYSWIDSARVLGGLRKKNRERLGELRKAAEAWNRASQVPPGRFLTANLGQRPSLLQVLRSAPLDLLAVFQTIEAIRAAQREATKVQSLGERLRALGFADRSSPSP